MSILKKGDRRNEGQDIENGEVQFQDRVDIGR